MNEQSVFIAALEREPADRARFLDQACENNPGLRQRVERLLASHEAAVSFMDEPAGQLVNTVDQPPLETSGAQIGPYKLLQEIGQGGMGVVYMAEQVEPVRRKVALKIIKPGMDTRQVIARFEAERQALSLMDHPNIAKVLDAGTTRTGRPYFVMELVKGQPIIEYCDQQHLTPRQRLELLLPVCQAIQHAHQKGIIHRDIKPSNILVAEYDQQAVPKVIDFGVAKAISQPLTEKTMFTGIGQIVGTLEYMSPEQAKVNQLDVDTRTDIYSLGVLMYELLTGTTPFDKQRLRSAGWDEMLRIIREEEPPKPSTRLSDSKDSLPSISAQRRTEPAKLTRLVRGELDWIVMKALEKDRSRRYETANSFAADVQRYLADEPVQACPPSQLYRWRKLVHKHRAAFTLVGTVTILLAASAGVSAWQAARARQAERQAAFDRDDAIRAAAQAAEQRERAEEERRRANEQRDIALAVGRFLEVDLLGQNDPENQAGIDEGGGPRGPHLTIRDALDRAARHVGSRFADQPLVEAAIRLSVAGAYEALGEYDAARPHAERAYELRAEQLGVRQPESLDALALLARLAHHAGDRDKAEQHYREIHAERVKLHGPSARPTLVSAHDLAFLLIDLDQLDEAEKLLRAVHRERVEQLGATHAWTLATQQNLAWLIHLRGRTDEAAGMFRDALHGYAEKLGSDHPGMLAAKHNLGLVLLAQQRATEAETMFQEAAQGREQVFGPRHPDTLSSRVQLALVYSQRKHHEAAISILEQSLEAARLTLGNSHPMTVHVQENLIHVLLAADQASRAVPLLEDLRSAQLSLRGAGDRATQRATRLLARSLWISGEADRALATYSELVASARASLAPRHALLRNLLGEVGGDLLGFGRFSEAESPLRECLGLLRETAPEAWETFDTASRLGEALARQGKNDEAEALLVEGYDGLKRLTDQLPATRRGRLSQALERLIRFYRDLGRVDQAQRYEAERSEPP